MEVVTEVDTERVRRLLDDDVFFWLDLIEPTNDHLEELAEALGLHPAALEDTQEWGQLPRLDDYRDHVMLVFFSAQRVEDRVEPVECHVYVSGNWIFTARRCETRLDGLRGWLERTDYEEEDQVLYLILDALADGWDPVIDEVDRRVDDVEIEVLERPQREHLTTIYRLKQEVGELLRRAGPQAQSIGQAIRVIHDLPDLERGSREWLRDVEAHVDAVASDLRRLAGDLSALTDTFFNANANRLNRLATLTAIGSVFFLIWTFVTGFFGQNFAYLEEHIDSKGAFFGYEIGALLLPTLILAVVLWRRRKDWW